MHVPALAWPPMFLNQAFKEFCVFTDDATVIIKTPGITGVVKNGVGDYIVSWSKNYFAIALPFLIENEPLFVNADQIDPGVNNVQLRVFNTDGDLEDSNITAVFIFSIRDDWFQVP